MKHLDTMASWGAWNNTALDKIIVILIALGPFLQNYIGPINNAGTTALGIAFGLVVIKLLYGGGRSVSRVSHTMLKAMVWPAVFALYKVVAHGTTFTEAVEGLMLGAFYLAAAAGCINLRYLFKIAAVISVVGSIGIILQTICYYLFHFHITMVPVFLLKGFAQQWVGAVTTGLISITGRMGNFYRPTAFFLEPSHMCIYTFPTLFLLLLSPDGSRTKRNIAILISIGTLLSTSGMGIFITMGAWLLYFGTRNKKKNTFQIRNILRPRNLLIFLVIAVLLVLSYFTVPIVTQAVNRVIISNQYGNNAITGRTEQGMDLLDTLEGNDRIYGVSDSMSEYEFHLSSYVSTAYMYGWIGLAIFYMFYARNFFHLKDRYFWINFVITGLTFFSAHPGAFYMGLYYALILMEGYYDRYKDRIRTGYERRLVRRA